MARVPNAEVINWMAASLRRLEGKVGTCIERIALLEAACEFVLPCQSEQHVDEAAVPEVIQSDDDAIESFLSCCCDMPRAEGLAPAPSGCEEGLPEEIQELGVIKDEEAGSSRKLGRHLSEESTTPSDSEGADPLVGWPAAVEDFASDGSCMTAVVRDNGCSSEAEENDNRNIGRGGSGGCSVMAPLMLDGKMVLDNGCSSEVDVDSSGIGSVGSRCCMVRVPLVLAGKMVHAVICPDDEADFRELMVRKEQLWDVLSRKRSKKQDRQCTTDISELKGMMEQRWPAVDWDAELWREDLVHQEEAYSSSGG